MTKTLFLLCSLLFTLEVFSFVSETPEVSASVQKFIDTHGTDMNVLKPSCATFEACEGMRYQSNTFTFEGDAEKAFTFLIASKPKDVWQGSSNFEMMFDPASRSFLGKEDQLPSIALHQVFFIELKIAKRLKIPVAFEVVDLNYENLTVSFSYLKQNKSIGIQKITFVQEGDHFKLIHETHFQSESKFRDRYLYGAFHARLISDVWMNFKKRLKDET
jgi:hypothetical protein